MGNYTRERFLEYYKFKDEPEMVPYRFHRYYKSYENLIEKIEENISVRGMPIKAAFQKEGIGKWTYRDWKKAYEKELEDGKTDTPLIRLFATAEIADAKIHGDISECAINLANEGDTRMVMFLLEHRFGYKKNKKEVELSNKDNAPLQINIVDMKEESDE